MSFLDRLDWRYATKKYDGRIVPSEDLEKILEAIRMAPSSSGMQPYHIVVAEGKMKDALIENSGQTAKLGASHLLVFCTRTDFPERGQKQVEIAAALAGKQPSELSGLEDLVTETYEKWKNMGMLEPWAARQTYLALGFALAACTELGIDASPMEGFEPSEFHRILGLPQHIKPVVIMAVGYRDPTDPARPEARPKVRFPKDDLFEKRS